MQVLRRILGFFCISFIAFTVRAEVFLPSPETTIPLPPPFSSPAVSGFNLFYWPARASAWGFGGNRGIGIGDGMLPLVGNDEMMLYADGQGEYASDESWFGAVALGFREILDNNRIIGGYLFADRNEYSTGSNLSNSAFYFVSPGLESMGNIWDFRVNGYFPVSSQRDDVGSTFADNVGNFNFIIFRGHQQLDQLIDIFNVTGPGVDAEIGRVVPGLPNTRVFLGGYYFSPKNTSSIEGVEGRISYPVTHYLAFEVANSYDNTFKNSFEAGARITLGGIPDDVDKNNHDISRRMLDPVVRNLATLSRGTAEPVINIKRNEGKTVVERDNIYFFTSIDGTTFNAALGTQNCTFEHPCSRTSFTQSTVNSIGGFASNAFFYFDPGTYSLGGQLSLVNGQSMFGRIFGYKQPASGSGRPLFNGGLALPGNNTLDSFQLFNNGGAQTVGITATGSNILINNLLVGSLTNDGNNYPTGISLTNVNGFTATNSVINAFSTGTGDILAEAVNATGGSLAFTNDSINAATSATDPAVNSSTANGITISSTSLSINTSSITASTTVTPTSNPSAFATSINAGDNNVISVNNSAISATETYNSTVAGLSNANDIRLGSGNQLTVNNSSLTASNISTSGSVLTAAAVGIEAAGNNNSINVSQSNFSANASAVSFDATFGLAEGVNFAGIGNTLSVNNSNFDISANSSNPVVANAVALGIELGTAGNSGTVTNSNFTVSSNASSGAGASTAFGIDKSGGATLTQSGNTFNVTATGSAGITITQADISP